MEARQYCESSACVSGIVLDDWVANGGTAWSVLQPDTVGEDWYQNAKDNSSSPSPHSLIQTAPVAAPTLYQAAAPTTLLTSSSAASSTASTSNSTTQSSASSTHASSASTTQASSTVVVTSTSTVAPTSQTSVALQPQRNTSNAGMGITIPSAFSLLISTAGLLWLVIA